jgi:predicted nucleic acid-binding protein
VIELFDTSALILAARNPEAADVLRDAISGPGVAVTDIIVLEYLNGARNLAEYDRFARTLDAAVQLRAESTDWDRVRYVHRQLAASGPGHQRSASLPDLVIAAVAERGEVMLVHYDEDYERIAAITGQPTRWVVPRGSA